MLSDAFKSIFGTLWWKFISNVEYETIWSIASIMSVSHLFMIGYTKLYKDDIESIESEEIAKELIEYREFLEEKREYLNIVCKELDMLSNTIDKINEQM